MKNWKEPWRRLLERIGLLPPAEVHYIGGSDTLPPPLSREREAVLLERIGDEDARKELIEHNLRLVVYIARRFENTGINIEDLISIGTIGLIKAINTFQPAKNIKLATYASRCIENEILMYFRSRRKSLQDVSISDPIDIDKDGNSLTLMDVMSEDDNLIDQLDCKMKMEQLYRLLEEKLSPRQREVLTCRYGLYGMRSQTQREVAARLGISRSYVSRIEKKAIEILAKYLR